MATYYCTSSELRAYLDMPATDTSHDALLNAIIPRAQAEIERQTGRTFQSSSSVHYYNEDYARILGRSLFLDTDLLSVTTITNGNEEDIDTDNCWLEPRNGPPYGVIRLKTSESWIFNTDGEIEIDGVWGYASTVPADINHACIRLAAYIYKQREAQVFDVVGDAATGLTTIPQGIPKDVAKILKPFRKTL